MWQRTAASSSVYVHACLCVCVCVCVCVCDVCVCVSLTHSTHMHTHSPPPLTSLCAANKNRYEGEWEGDLKHGEGTFYYVNKVGLAC